jgi:phosphoribosylformylglycinamidine (FGAM) synthase PurS component
VKQWRFEVFNRAGFPDVHGASVLEDIGELGIDLVEAVESAKVF